MFQLNNKRLFEFTENRIREDSLDWTNKRVAIIGNGSSAVQIAPHIQRTASKMVNFIRSPTWISANYLTDRTKDGGNFKYTEEEKRNFRDNPEKLFAMRKELEHE